VYCAGVVLGATLAAAVWLYTYRVSTLVQYIEYIGRTRRHFRPSERVMEQPWWGVPATVGLILIGASVSLWLLPQRRRVIERVGAFFVKPSV